MHAGQQNQTDDRRNSPTAFLGEAKTHPFCHVRKILAGKGCVWVQHLEKQELLALVVPNAWHACVGRAEAGDRRKITCSNQAWAEEHVRSGKRAAHLTVVRWRPRVTATSAAFSREIVAGASKKCIMIFLSMSSADAIVLQRVRRWLKMERWVEGS